MLGDAVAALMLLHHIGARATTPLTPRTVGWRLSLLEACMTFARTVHDVRLVQPVACRVVPKLSPGW
jgi:hypothetical protein